LLPEATHDVHVLTLAPSATEGGARHVAHESWHGRQKLVPLAAVPRGQTAAHRPPLSVWLLLAHVMQVPEPAPSQVAQLAWQLVHAPPPLRYIPSGHVPRHAPSSKFGRSHGRAAE
jgi:hypothetical protein